MGEVIVITSGKGGVGKTTTTANLGTGLAKLNKKVVMIDTDIGLRDLDAVLGLENQIVYNIVDIAEGNCKSSQAMVQDPRYENLYLIPAAQTKDKSAITPEQMKQITDQLKTEFDYVILDCPAGIEQGFQNAVSGADKAIVVTTPEVSSIRDADRIIGILETKALTNPLLIINRLRPDMIEKGAMLAPADVVDILAIELLGQVPDDEHVVIATNSGEPLVGDSSLAGRAYMNICHRLLGESVPFLDLQPKKNIFTWLIDKIRKGN